MASSLELPSLQEQLLRGPSPVGGPLQRDISLSFLAWMDPSTPAPGRSTTVTVSSKDVGPGEGKAGQDGVCFVSPHCSAKGWEGPFPFNPCWASDSLQRQMCFFFGLCTV